VPNGNEIRGGAIRSKCLKMAAAYEDNFGFWNIDEPEEQAFFEHVQQQSVPTICERCERPVRLMPPKALCAICVCALEWGAPASMSEYEDVEPRALKPHK
jgi:hypothetical protein